MRKTKVYERMQILHSAILEFNDYFYQVAPPGSSRCFTVNKGEADLLNKFKCHPEFRIKFNSSVNDDGVFCGVEGCPVNLCYFGRTHEGEIC